MRIKPFCLLIVLASACGLANAESAQIVKRFHLYNQTGGIAPVAIYTPRAGHGGMFRVNTFVVTTVATKYSGSFCEQLGFTTRFGDTQAYPTNGAFCASASQVGGNIEGTIPIADEGGKPITFSVFTNGDTSGAKYDVTIIVEKF